MTKRKKFTVKKGARSRAMQQYWASPAGMARKKKLAAQAKKGKGFGGKQHEAFVEPPKKRAKRKTAKKGVRKASRKA